MVKVVKDNRLQPMLLRTAAWAVGIQDSESPSMP